MFEKCSVDHIPLNNGVSKEGVVGKVQRSGSGGEKTGWDRNRMGKWTGGLRQKKIIVRRMEVGLRGGECRD